MSTVKVPSAWRNLESLPARDWQCGVCGKNVASRSGYYTDAGASNDDATIYICPGCQWPTLFFRGQHPGVRFGSDIDHLPTDVARIYNQARDCCRVGAFDGAALLARTLLMHVAVSRGEKPNLPFVDYVNFLEANHYTPPDSKDWVDHVRKQGGRAAHDIAPASPSDAEELMVFAELLLRYLYDFPGRMRLRGPAAKAP